jgi:uncharacterized protein YdhG (YjbR/CyaY superfamily)
MVPQKTFIKIIGEDYNGSGYENNKVTIRINQETYPCKV